MKVLITGGLGLVGANYAAHCLYRGDQVVVLDNHSRGLSTHWNRAWLLEIAKKTGSTLRDLALSIENPRAIDRAIEVYDGLDAVVHCAAQSSVDASMENPERDFISNVMGTFNVLEMLRRNSPRTKFIYVASNKVYDVTTWKTIRQGSRYVFADRSTGPSEAMPFYTDAKEPYGASKICGLYYTRCYAAMYEMPAVVCVPSGMYGPRQFGKSEQGWLGWFTIAVSRGLPITIKGDGFQVRDMLHVEDVCSAFDVLLAHAETHRGELFNLGGGRDNAISLIEALEIIQKGTGKGAMLRYEDWRAQDNKVYISNIERLRGLGWVPSIGIEDGILKMCEWVEAEREMLNELYPDAA